MSVESYDKVMGAYSDAVDSYNTEAEAFNKLPYVIAGGRSGNTLQYADGSRSPGSFQSYIEPGTRVTPTTWMSTSVRGSGSREISGWKAAPTPVAPADPNVKAPTFTRAEATALQNPPDSLASQAGQSASVMSRVKDGNNISGSAYRGSMDSSAGILQKVIKGQL